MPNLYDLSAAVAVAEVIGSRAFSEFCGAESSNSGDERRYVGSVPEFTAPQRAAGKAVCAGDISATEKRPAAEEGNPNGHYADRSAVLDEEQGKEMRPRSALCKKGNSWRSGYKTHIGVDKSSGLVHTVKVTSANIHDVTVASERLTGDEDSLRCSNPYPGHTDPLQNQQMTLAEQARRQLFPHADQTP